MAPVLFCKCTQCICTATVLINTVEENQSSDDKFQDLSKTTNNYSSSYENIENQATSTVMHPFVSGDSRGSLEFIFVSLLLILLLICEYDFNYSTNNNNASVLVSYKLYSEIKRNLELGRPTSYTFSKQFGEVEVGLQFNVKKASNKGKDNYFDDDLTKILSSFDPKLKGEVK